MFESVQKFLQSGARSVIDFILLCENSGGFYSLVSSYLKKRSSIMFIKLFGFGGIDYLDNKVCEISYFDGLKVQKVRFSRDKPICNIIGIQNEHGQDITSKIIQYSGMRWSFYGIPTTPKLLGHEKLKVIYLSGERMLNENDEF